MAAPSAVRVKLLFDFPPPAVPHSSTLWFLVDQSKCRVVADLASVIRDRFFYGLSGGISLYLENGLLIPGESVLIVRDNDCIKVQWEGSCQDGARQSPTKTISPPKRRKNRRREKSEDEHHVENNAPLEPDVPLQENPRSVSPTESVRPAKKRKKRRKRSKDVADVHSEVPAQIPSPKITCSDSKMEVNCVHNNSDSDTLVIKKASDAARFPQPFLTNGNSVELPDDQQWPAFNPYTSECGRRDFPRRGWRGRDIRMRGDRANRARRDDSFSYSCAARTKALHPNESVTNQSIVMQNPLNDHCAPPVINPQPGMVISFKLLELSENYTPEVSDYKMMQCVIHTLHHILYTTTSVGHQKKGRILSYNSLTQDLELEILSPKNASREPGKFDLVYEFEDGTSRVEYAITQDSKMTQKWSSLIDPKCVAEMPSEGPVLQTENTDF